jgi:predicted nucleic acid-binding protein
LTLVVDASVAVPACTRPDGFGRYEGESLVAPPLMWSEARSVLHRAVSRGSLDLELGRNALDRLENAPVGPRSPRRLGYEAWRIADELGWAKTYDAEYVALAALLGCRLVTLDARLRRSADRLSLVVSPLEL